MKKLLTEWRALDLKTKATVGTAGTLALLVFFSVLITYWPDLAGIVVLWIMRVALVSGFVALIYWGWVTALTAFALNREKSARKDMERQRNR